MRIHQKNRFIVEKLLDSNEAKISFSQLGEDAIVNHYLSGKSSGFYVDVGCFDPLKFSNTAALHNLLGWSGINIDTNINSIEKFKIHRPNDTNLNYAVGKVKGRMPFGVFADGAVNSLDADTVKRQSATFGNPEFVEVDVLPLSEIFDLHLPPGKEIDLLDIDAEGWDHDVLSSNNWNKYRPEIVLVETHGFTIAEPSLSPTYQLMRAAGYALVSHAVVTSVYKRE